MPFYYGILLVAYCILIGFAIKAAAKRKWWVVVIMLGGICLLWYGQKEKFLGTIEAGETRVALYYDPGDEGFVFARASRNGTEVFGYDVVLAQGTGKPAKVRAFRVSSGDAIWIFVDDRPVILHIGTANITEGAKAGALPADAVELTLRR